LVAEFLEVEEFKDNKLKNKYEQIKPEAIMG
jgi:hypothetical protein